MKPSEIISLARRQTGCTEDIVTTDEAFRFLNFVIEDFWADIRSSDSWHWFDYINIDVNAGQYTYQIDENAGEWYNNFPISKIERVWYRMPDWKWRDLDVRFIDKIDINDFPNQWEPEICFLCNNTINLIPEPKTATTMIIYGYDYNWELMPDLWTITVNNNYYTRNKNLDIDWATHPYAWSDNTMSTIYTDSQKPTSWTAYTTYNWSTSAWSISSYQVQWFDSEDNIFIPKRWHYILVEWLKYRMYGNMWVNFEWARTNSRNFYDSEKMKALQNIVDRWQESDEPYYPDLNFLNY